VGNPYSVQVADAASGAVHLAGNLTFTDPANQPGSVRLVGPYSFAFDTPGLLAAVTVLTPAAGDVLLDAWIDVTTGFNGTTPKADIGSLDNTSSPGLWGIMIGAPIPLATAGAAVTSNSHLWAYAANGVVLNPSLSSAQASVVVAAAGTSGGTIPYRFLDATPLKLVVSTNGRKSGSAIGGSAGAAALYLLVATPVSA
jgi:hypothetical protein